jgi:hypothetical protein
MWRQKQTDYILTGEQHSVPTPKGERALGVFENTVLRGIFGNNGDQATESW